MSQGKTINQLAKQLNIVPTTMSSWASKKDNFPRIIGTKGTITIHEDSEIELNGMYLSPKFTEDFAINDGFNCLDEFIDFFKIHYGLPFSGILIKWQLYDCAQGEPSC
jgi:hypothetical protein